MIGFNTAEAWVNELTLKRDEIKARRVVLEVVQQKALGRRTVLVKSNAPDPFQRIKETFNQTYTPQDWMTAYGYDSQDNSFRHPKSQSGNYSATVMADANGVLRVNTLSTSDPLYTSEGGAHDAFSAFTVLMHGGDMDAAIKDAGDNLLTIGSVSYNKVAQIEWAKEKAAQLPQTDHSALFCKSDSHPQKPSLAFKFADVGELMNRAYEPDFLIDTLFEKNALGQIFGATGCCKTFVALDMAYCIATGFSYNGLLTKQGNVAYICGEGFRAIGRRVKALQCKYGVDINGKLFISEQPGAFIDLSVTQTVAEAIKAIGDVSLVIIDTYHRNMGGGNENSADDFGLVLRNIDSLLKPLGVTVLIVHHSGHLDAGRSRGSSAIRAAMDFEYQVTKSTDTVTLKPTKIKDGTTPPAMVFTLTDCEIGLNKAGKPITSAYLDSKIGEATASSQSTKKLNVRDEAILTCLDEAIKAHGITPDVEIKAKYGGFNSSVGKLQKIVRVDEWRALAYKAITVDSEVAAAKADAKKKAFARASKKLADTLTIVVYGVYAWRFLDEIPPQGDTGQQGDK